MNQITVTNPITPDTTPQPGDLYRNPNYPSDVYVLTRWDSIYQMVNILTGGVWHEPSRILKDQIKELERVPNGTKIELIVK